MCVSFLIDSYYIDTQNGIKWCDPLSHLPFPVSINICNKSSSFQWPVVRFEFHLNNITRSGASLGSLYQLDVDLQKKEVVEPPVRSWNSVTPAFCRGHAKSNKSSWQLTSQLFRYLNIHHYIITSKFFLKTCIKLKGTTWGSPPLPPKKTSVVFHQAVSLEPVEVGGKPGKDFFKEMTNERNPAPHEMYKTL